MDTSTFESDDSRSVQNQQDVGAHSPSRIKSLPACDVCGRQDETLRLVSYPFVVSFLVVTSRRAFSGLWCRTHRLQKRGFASLITVVLGWFGIPFGIIFTPVALFKLVQGGDQPKDANRSLLRELAESKSQKGDAAGAARCLEQALIFGDEEVLSRDLTRLYQISPATVPSAPGSTFLTFLIVLIVASVLGLAIGFIDYLITAMFVGFVGESVSIYVAILTWIPLIALIFLVGLALSGMVRWALARSRIQENLLGISLALMASFLAFYGIYEGLVVGEFLKTVFSVWPYASVSEAILAIGNLLTQGGFWAIEGSIVSGVSADIIFFLITVAGAVFYLTITVSGALSTLDWGRLLVQLTPTPVRRTALGGWAAIGSSIVGLAMVTLLFYSAPQTTFGGDSPEIEPLLEEANSYFSQGDFETGISLLESAAQMAPRSFSTHVMLGWAYYYTGEHANALTEFEIVQEIAPGRIESYLGMGFAQNALDEFEPARASFEQAMSLATDDYSIAQAHYGLGEGFYFQEHFDEAIPHLEQAIRHDPGLSLAYLELSIAYSGRGEFYNAISQCEILVGLDPEWAAPHAMLALLHYMTDNAADSEIELARALALNPEDGYSLYTLAAAYSQMIRFPKAEEIMLRMAVLSPDNPQVLTNLAALYTAQGKFQTAMDTISHTFVLDDAYMQAHLTLAQIYVDQEQLDMALESLRQASQALPDDHSLYSMYAYVHYLRGELTEAQNKAEGAIALNPYNGDAYRMLAFALLDQGQLEDAYEAALEALRLSPKSGTGHYVLGLILVERGDTAQAIHELETFLELYWDQAYTRRYKENAETLLAELKSNP